MWRPVLISGCVFVHVEELTSFFHEAVTGMPHFCWELCHKYFVNPEKLESTHTPLSSPSSLGLCCHAGRLCVRRDQEPAPVERVLFVEALTLCVGRGISNARRTWIGQDVVLSDARLLKAVYLWLKTCVCLEFFCLFSLCKHEQTLPPPTASVVTVTVALREYLDFLSIAPGKWSWNCPWLCDEFLLCSVIFKVRSGFKEQYIWMDMKGSASSFSSNPLWP